MPKSISNIPTLKALSLVAGLAANIGCGVDDSDPAFSFEWGLIYVGDGEAVSCEDAGTPRVDLDVLNLTTNAVFHDMFTCDQHRGVSQVLPSGAYTATARLRDAAGRIVAESVPTRDNIYRHGRTYLGTVPFQIQSFDFAWSLFRNNSVVTCAEVGGDVVELITQLGEDAPIKYRYACSARGGSTTAVQIGNYSIQLRLLDAGGRELSSTQPMTFRVDNKTRAVLPDTTFEVL